MTDGFAFRRMPGSEGSRGARFHLWSALPALAAALILLLAWAAPAQGERAFADKTRQASQTPPPDRARPLQPEGLTEHSPKPATRPASGLVSGPASAPAPGAASGAAPGPAPEPSSSPDSPRRVVCLAPSAAEIACALGRADRLVGAAAFSDFPEAAARLPRVGSYADPDVERVLALTPDLCLGVAGMTPPGCVKRLREFGLRVELLETRDLASVLRSIVRVGQLLKAVPQAEVLTADMRRRMDAVARAVGPTAHRPAVLYQIGADPMHAAGADTFLDELIRLAGGRNVCAAMPGYPRLSLEQAVALRPEAICIPTMGRDRFGQARDRWTAWPEVPAVRSGRIHVLDSDLYDRPGPRLVEGLEEMARLLHPEAFLQDANPTQASQTDAARKDSNRPSANGPDSNRPDTNLSDDNKPDTRNQASSPSETIPGKGQP